MESSILRDKLTHLVAMGSDHSLTSLCLDQEYEQLESTFKLYDTWQKNNLCPDNYGILAKIYVWESCWFSCSKSAEFRTPTARIEEKYFWLAFKTN